MAKLYDLVYISLCFVIPLIIISVLYLRVCHHLWTSPLPGCTLQANRSGAAKQDDTCCTGGSGDGNTCVSETAIKLIIERRKKVIKLLITIVLAFALLCAPFHVRKLAQHYWPSYDVSTNFATISTIVTTLLLYSNSGVNPLIYLIFSRKLRRLMINVVYRLFGKLKVNYLSEHKEHHYNQAQISNNTFSQVLLPNFHRDEYNCPHNCHIIECKSAIVSIASRHSDKTSIV